MAVSDVRKPATKHVQVTEGDSARLQLLFKDNLGNLLDMSQYDGSIAPIIDSVSNQELARWAVDLTDAVVGVIVLTLTTDQTTALCPCKAAWYFKAIETADALNNSHTLLVGEFSVLKRRAFGG
jgi:hypothetical protein